MVNWLHFWMTVTEAVVIVFFALYLFRKAARQRDCRKAMLATGFVFGVFASLLHLAETGFAFDIPVYMGSLFAHLVTSAFVFVSLMLIFPESCKKFFLLFFALIPVFSSMTLFIKPDNMSSLVIAGNVLASFALLATLSYICARSRSRNIVVFLLAVVTLFLAGIAGNFEGYDLAQHSLRLLSFLYIFLSFEWSHIFGSATKPHE